MLLKGAVIFCFALLGVRLVYVQGVLRSDMGRRADQQFPVTDSTAERRPICDRDGAVLSETVPVSSCFADPTVIRDRKKTANQLAKILGMNDKAVYKRLSKSKSSFVWIQRDVPANRMQAIKALKIAGVGFKTETRRHYPMGITASHLLGLVGTEGKGLSGIEQQYEKTLAGDADGKGGRVVLTLDARIQQIAERELEWGAKKTGAKRATVVIQNPKTGEILAMASWPPVSLDPDNPPAVGDLRVPAAIDVFEPGSTFKVVIAAAAIEEKIMSDSEKFDGEKGAWKVSSITIHDHEPQGRMTLEDIIVHSSNIGTAKIADRLGAPRLYQYARLFGFGAQAGSGLTGEAKGVLRPLNKWSGVSKYTVSFGQEMSASALQLVAAFSAIANGGVLLEPHVIKSIVNDDGDSIWTAEPTHVRRVVTDETAKKLTKILVQVVKKGTGVNAQIQWDPSTEVAGKTGTAQKWDPVHHRYSESLTLVSFCGFFPANDPQITMMVLIDEPQGRRWGGLDAAPVFRRIAEQLSPHLITAKKPDNV